MVQFDKTWKELVKRLKEVCAGQQELSWDLFTLISWTVLNGCTQVHNCTQSRIPSTEYSLMTQWGEWLSDLALASSKPEHSRQATVDFQFSVIGRATSHKYAKTQIIKNQGAEKHSCRDTVSILSGQEIRAWWPCFYIFVSSCERKDAPANGCWLRTKRIKRRCMKPLQIFGVQTCFVFPSWLQRLFSSNLAFNWIEGTYHLRLREQASNRVSFNG